MAFSYRPRCELLIYKEITKKQILNKIYILKPTNSKKDRENQNLLYTLIEYFHSLDVI